MFTNQEMQPNGSLAEEERRTLKQQAERSGFRNGALSVLTLVLMLGAFWIGLQAGPLL